MKQQPKSIVITGAESTGKTTLTEQLATHFGVPYIPEIARSYVEKLNRKYVYEDVEQIARMQIAEFKNFQKLNLQFIFMDTWLIITKVWFEFVYKRVPDWLIDEIGNTKIDLFLICDIDLPWIEDPVRENGCETRKILHNLYIKNITEYGFKYHIVNGLENKRFEMALKFVMEP